MTLYGRKSSKTIEIVSAVGYVIETSMARHIFLKLLRIGNYKNIYSNMKLRYIYTVTQAITRARSIGPISII